MEKIKKPALIILHEIYGINDFIKTQCSKFRDEGFDVFCPNLIARPAFSYEENAYAYFFEFVGFGVYQEINKLIIQLKQKYEKVAILGFSVGATIAWRCSENQLCDAIVACYGSRIRDYIELKPACPTFLLFAKEDFCDMSSTISQVQAKANVEVLEFTASHGFMDIFTKSFDLEAASRAEQAIEHFLLKYVKCSNL